MTRSGCLLLGGMLALAGAPAVDAQSTQRVRGTITAVDGAALSVRTRDGRDIRVEMTEKTSVAAARSITLADLKPGAYVGTTTRERPDGTLVALEVHTLPPTVAAGHRAWDLEPGSMMTNANVAAVVKAADGEELTLEYKEGSKKILVPPGTPIVTTVLADRAALKPGEYVFMSVNVAADGKMTVPGRIQVSRDGVRPPQ